MQLDNNSGANANINDIEGASFNSDQPYPSPHIRSIATGRGGSHEYSPEFQLSGMNCTGLVNMTMLGSRWADRAAFVRAYGYFPTCHFHHTFSFANGGTSANSTCSAQMVLAVAHIATYPHTGAVWQFKQVYPAFYAASNEDGEGAGATGTGDGGTFGEGELKEIYIDEELKANSRDIENFEYSYLLKIPEWLSEVFQGKRPLSAKFETVEGAAKGVVTVEHILQLVSKEKTAVTAELIRDLPATKAIFKRLFPNGNVIPFATDPCGNIFACVDGTTYFYDHEEDEALRATAITA